MYDCNRHFDAPLLKFLGLAGRLSDDKDGESDSLAPLTTPFARERARMVRRALLGIAGCSADPHGGPTLAVDSLSPPTRFVSLRSRFIPLRAPRTPVRGCSACPGADELERRLQCATLSGSRATLPAVSRAHPALTTSWSGTQSSSDQVSDVNSCRRICGS